MVTHLVFFNMREEANGHSGSDNAAELVKRLQALPAQIPEIVTLEAGTDISRTAASWDVGLLTQFRSKDDLETYRIHPEHQKVIDFVGETTSERSVVDFES